jgi:hypothetical protein
MSIERKVTYIFSSDPTKGAQAIQQDGSVFSVNLQYPISLPIGTQYATMEVHSASIWYVTPNISEALGNNRLTINDGVNDYPLVIADGLYNFPQLVNAIQITFNSQTLPVPPAHQFEEMFAFNADNATQRVAISVLQAYGTITWNVPNPIRNIFGFTDAANDTTPPVAILVAPRVYVGNEQAAFNAINQFYISGNLVHTGIPSNSNSSNLMAVVYIDRPPGSQINFQPQQPLLIDAAELIGGQRTNFTFRLTNERFEPLDTFGEYWSFIITIRFWL